MTTVTKAEHEARLAELHEYLRPAVDAILDAYARNVDVPDNISRKAALLTVAARILDAIPVESDRDADLVWRGSDFGMAFAVCDVGELAKRWSTSRKKSTENLTKKQQPAKTDDQYDDALRKNNNNISAAARDLKVDRKTVERYMKRRRTK